MPLEEIRTTSFDAIRLTLASPDDIHDWSYGEVTKPETINYRTQKPEKDGLFAEEIFGPSKDWECYCGKYKRIRYKGIICDKCGVEVTRSVVRRERMGHIDLSAPVSHIWFLRGVPSKIGLVLDMSVSDLEKVIYFANFIISKVDEGLRTEALKQIDDEAVSKHKQIDAEFARLANEIRAKKAVADGAKSKTAELDKRIEDELTHNAMQKEEQVKELENTVDLAKHEIRSLKVRQVIAESTYQDLSVKYGHIFEASIGAEAIHHLLLGIDLDAEIKSLEVELVDAKANKNRKVVRRLKLLRNLKINGIRPEWMILTVLPVIPPDLRPMVQLDGGRFAASDLNDLYRRVINRNNRLKKLIELNAPEVITRNEKRMLQEAVDALVDNGARHGKTVTAATGQKRQLKSIADMLKGKQGRFRQNLLGKRVDYSGRSVIVVGPHLKLNQCGLPKQMALELFKPYVISQLIKREFVHNVRSAGRFIESGRAEVWDILEEITQKSHVLLNRAPTLHRLGIQAFQPILIEGKAIQVHPLVCPAFNADFDGDQMAVHVPLTERAKDEAANLMLSSKNLLKPATGEPVVSPSQDIVLGCYYMTYPTEKPKAMKAFGTTDEALMAYGLSHINIHTPVKVMIDDQVLETTVGRIIFNTILPDDLPFVNDVMDKKRLRQIIAQVLDTYGKDRTVQLLDDLMSLSFKYLTLSGFSWGMDDLPRLDIKASLIKASTEEVDQIEAHFASGLLTEVERRQKVIRVWELVKERITEESKKALDPTGSVYAMIESGSRGSWAQTTQMMGMKGLVTNPAGDIIELPVKASFKEGFNVLEYFISTHGARKGLSDTALRTANAGYLTRRLIDVSQDVVITDDDCGDTEGLMINKAELAEVDEEMPARVWGRVLASDLVNPRTKKPVFKAGHLITEEDLPKISKLDPDQVHIRSILTCKTLRGLCQQCYGYDLGHNKLVEHGTAVGIIAAQSIGEPGTQLTMRTFHTGGVASSQDITQGLPRVEELFEVRPIKRAGLLSQSDGQVAIEENGKQRVIKINALETVSHRYPFPKKRPADFKPKVKDGQKVGKAELLWEAGDEKMYAKHDGTVQLNASSLAIIGEGDKLYEYAVPENFSLWVKPGDMVTKGQQLTEGALDLNELYHFRSKEATQKYIIREISYIYSSQGQKLNDKHVEVIVRQMFSRVLVSDPGDTKLLMGELVTASEAEEINIETKKEKKQPASVVPLLLGISKASLATDSFLSAASFQETARVLIDAAITGRVDRLRGLKENVIIGKLIPAGTGYGVDPTAEVIEDDVIDKAAKDLPVDQPLIEKAQEIEAPKAETLAVDKIDAAE